MGLFSGLTNLLGFGGGGGSSFSSGGAFNRETSNSSESNTTSNTYNTDNRVTAGNGALVLGDRASYWLDQGIDYTDSSVTLTDGRSQDTFVYDSSNRSQQFTDNSDNSRDTLFYDIGDRSQTFTDSRDLSSYFLDSSDRSQTFTDSRDLSSYFLDSSNRSTTTTTTNITGIDPGAVRVAEFGAELVRDLGEQQTEGMRLVAGFGANAIRFMGESATDLYAQAGQNLRGVLETADSANARAASTWAQTLTASSDLLGGILQRAGNTADAAGRLAEVAILQAQPADGKNADTMRTALLVAAGLAALLIVPKLLKA